MKQILFVLIVTLAACDASVTVEPVTPRSVYASRNFATASNVAVNRHSVVAVYPESETQFTLLYSQCAVIEMNGRMETVDCEVFQLTPVVFIAQIGPGEYIRINAETGRTELCDKSGKRMFLKETP